MIGSRFKIAAALLAAAAFLKRPDDGHFILRQRSGLI